jgi:hypothetical protein
MGGRVLALYRAIEAQTLASAEVAEIAGMLRDVSDGK